LARSQNATLFAWKSCVSDSSTSEGENGGPLLLVSGQNGMAYLFHLVLRKPKRRDIKVRVAIDNSFIEFDLDYAALAADETAYEGV
jgi:hypothetical protein